MTVSLPKYADVVLPTLKAVQSLGGSGSISEIVSEVFKQEGYTEEQQDVLHNGGPQTQIGYLIAWARSNFKSFGMLNNSRRGVWSITEAGDQFLKVDEPDSQKHKELMLLQSEKNREARLAREAKQSAATTHATQDEDIESHDGDDTDDLDTEASWKKQVLATLTSDTFTPTQFERLTQRVFREASFDSVKVTGRTGDQGIDGVGTYRLGLLSFPVYFQCKRYKGSVGAGEVRDFRGALQGRGEKGILLSTGAFTAAAKNEAQRDGATPIDLIDGDQLCDLLKEYDLGVTTTERIVEEITVDPEFFFEI